MSEAKQTRWVATPIGEDGKPFGESVIVEAVEQDGLVTFGGISIAFPADGRFVGLRMTRVGDDPHTVFVPWEDLEAGGGTLEQPPSPGPLDSLSREEIDEVRRISELPNPFKPKPDE